jgi:hypothetical protein
MAVKKQLQAALKVINDIRKTEGYLENNPALENVNEKEKVDKTLNEAY